MSSSSSSSSGSGSSSSMNPHPHTSAHPHCLATDPILPLTGGARVWRRPRRGVRPGHSGGLRGRPAAQRAHRHHGVWGGVVLSSSSERRMRSALHNGC
jgi:hypothetical protein